MTINRVINEEITYYVLINESFSWKEVLKTIARVPDKKAYIKTLIDKYNNEINDFIRKKTIKLIVAAAVFAFPMLNQQKMYSELSRNDKLSIEMVEKIATENTENKTHNFVDPQQLTLSNEGLNLIKGHETLKLDAYDIGDGKITVGYGHAEPKGHSQFKLGQKITQEQADKLLSQDLDEAISGAKRMFAQWKQRGNDIKVTQGMFDSIVSMMYNMGVSGFRNTEFAEELEAGKNPLEIAEKIKNLKLKKGFGGLVKRRADEFKRFISKD